MLPDLHIHPEVSAALGRGDAVVALESTIVAHGMPWPRNLETARAVEEMVRAQGAVPATIAVLGGRLTVGLTGAELEHLARAEGVLKLSRRDLAYAVSQRRDGATTVAATMLCAARAGIRVFVTGGIGGVHRDAEQTMDVSADLTELSRTPVAVVCAGAKAILDLPRTLEALETLGVPVIGFGTNRFPAFYTRDSGLPVPMRLDTADEVAALIAAQGRLGLEGGVLVAVPVPEASELPPELAEAAVLAALAEAAEAGVYGKELTPFLLRAVEQHTGGQSLAANQALVLENARVGGAVARGLQHVVHVSTVAVFVPPHAPVITADGPMASPRTEYGRSKVAAERYVRGLQDEGAPVSIVYPGGVTGPRQPVLDAMNQGLVAGLSQVWPLPPGGVSVVDVRDLGTALARGVTIDAGGRLVLGGHFLSWHALADLCDELTGVRCRRLPVPGGLMLGLGSALDLAKRVKNFGYPLTRDAAEIMTTMVPSDDRPALETLGLNLRPVDETLTDTLRWLAASGHLSPRRAGRLAPGPRSAPVPP